MEICQDRSVDKFVTMPDNLSLIPETHFVEREN